MRSCVRFSFLALLIGVIVAVSAPAAQAAFEIAKFAAVNCEVGHEECAHEFVGPYSVTKEPTKEDAEKEGYTQAGGRVPFGVTDFTVATTGTLPEAAPTGVVKHIRTDVAPGLATSPAAVPQCTEEEFGTVEAVKGTGLFPAPTCKKPETEIGTNEVTVYEPLAKKDIPLKGVVYNLQQKPGLASEFGVALDATNLGAPGLFAHTIIEGNVEWGMEPLGTNLGDYHDYFNINVSTALQLVSSRLVFKGRSGNGAFITNATNCPGHNTTRLALTDTENVTVTRPFTTPIGLSGCNLVPFNPSFAITPATTGSDEPDGFTTEVAIPHVPTATDDSQLKTATIKLPEGMTLNPSAAPSLAACTPAQARIHSSEAGTSCPAASELGTVELEVPTLPGVSLTGKMFLGGPESGPITGPPYIIYLDAESARYGVSVRIKGEVVPNETTGQVTAAFNENPEQPFTKAVLHLKEGALAPVANPLACGAAASESSLVPYSPESPTRSLASAFVVTGCPASLPFALTQSTVNGTANAGGHTSFTFSLARRNGEQYLRTVSSVLPGGLVGAIPTVTTCEEPKAANGECPASSEIGTATALSGAGPQPVTFSHGTVYLTGPTKGAPYGMSIVVPAVSGPFNLGNVTTVATINVDPHSGRVIITASPPLVVKGVPVRLRGVTIAVNKTGFLFNPTNCSLEQTESTLTSTFGATQTGLNSPFQVGECAKLAFKPSFKAASGAKTSKANGASIETTINQGANQANIKSVQVTLPKALPSRLTTLQKACPAATFEANPFSCPSGSFVGGVRANTPVLPAKMKGPAILVSHANAAFPDLDLVLEGNGVRVILVGNTDIKKGITTSTFASTPDVPVSSITVNLPIGKHSALAATGNLCAQRLLMPTTIVSQSGKTIKQNTVMRVTGCGVRIVGRRVIGNTAFLTVQTFAAGRISGGGGGLATRYRSLRGAVKATTLKVPLSRGGLSRRRPFRTRVRVGFVPKQRGAPTSVAFATVTFR